MAFDRVGRLWVWSNDTDRYDVFAVNADSASFLFRVSSGILEGNKSSRITFDHAANIIHPTSVPFGDGRRRVRLHIDTAGREVRRVYPPHVSPDNLGMVELKTTSPFGKPMSVYLSVPSTAANPITHSPVGGYADAITSRYVIRWFDESGTLIRLVTRPIQHGPSLTAAERGAAEDALSKDRVAADEARAKMPDVKIPTYKHPMEDVFFDLDGRLWVTRPGAASDTISKADLFDANGEYLVTVAFPSRVSLSYGTATGDIAYGIGRDKLDVASVVRLRIPIHVR